MRRRKRWRMREEVEMVVGGRELEEVEEDWEEGESVSCVTWLMRMEESEGKELE